MEIFYTPKAARDLARLERNVAKRIATKMRWFATQKDPLSFAKPLVVYEAYRFKIGDYRIIFDIADTAAIHILMIDKRDKSYKRF